MKTQNHLNFYQGFQTLEDIEKEIQNELKGTLVFCFCHKFL